MHKYCIVNQSDILYNKIRSIDLTTKTITKYRKGKGDSMLEISTLSKHMFMLYGEHNEYLISKSYTGKYKLILVRNNPEAKPLCSFSTLDDCIAFVCTVDNRVQVD